MAVCPNWRYRRGLQTVGHSMRAGHRTLASALEALTNKPKSTAYSIDELSLAWSMSR